MYYSEEMAIKLELKMVKHHVDLMRLRYLMGEKESEKQIRRIRKSLDLIRVILEDYEYREK